MTVEFPPEVLQLILDAVYKPSSLSLVSRVFLHLVRRRIFRSVVIKTYPSKRVPHDAPLLLDILSATPGIIQYVSSVRLVFRPINPWQYDYEYIENWTPKCCSVHAAKPSTCPGRNDPNIAKVLYLLSKGCVEHLEINDADDGPKFDDKILDAVFALRTSPSLASLSLDHSSKIPLFVINGIPSRDTLTELKLGKVKWWSSNADTLLELPGPVKDAHDEFMSGVPPFRSLARLTMTDCGRPCIFPRAITFPSWAPPLVDRITPIYGSATFPNLKSLRVEPYGSQSGLEVDDWVMVANLLSRAPALEKFSVFSVFSWDRPNLLNENFTNIITPALKMLPRLCTIELTDDPCDLSSNVFADRVRIMDALRRLAVPLEHVHFGFAFRRRRSPSEDEDEDEDEHTDQEVMAIFEECWGAGWVELGRAVRRIEKLESVSLALSFNYLLHEQDPWDTMIEELREVVVRSLNDPHIAVSVVSKYGSY